MDFDATHAVLAALERGGVRWAVFGAAALNLHGLPRFTEDLDLFIALEPENVERLKQALNAVFEDPEVKSITAADLLGAY